MKEKIRVIIKTIYKDDYNTSEQYEDVVNRVFQEGYYVIYECDFSMGGGYTILVKEVYCNGKR